MAAEKTDRLTTDMLANAAMHRLVLLLSSAGVDVVVTSLGGDAELIHRHIDFPADTPVAAALREVVYDNPLLTADFNSVSILVDSPRFFVMASADATYAEMRRRIDMLWPAERDGEDLKHLVNEVEKGHTVVVTAFPHEILSFLRRTWNRPLIVNRIAVLARFYALKKSLGNMGKIYANINSHGVDIVAVGRDGLMFANTFRTPGGVADATFYVLAVARQLNFDNDMDRVFVGGHSPLRDELVASLRKFLPLVMPEIYPAVVNEFGGADKVPVETLLITQI